MASLGDSDSVYSSVKDYYGKVLESTKDLKTSACTAGSAPHPIVRQIIGKVPQAVVGRFFGCGNPIPLGIEGKDVLDLGSGSGRDCYVAAALVGREGSVTGVDMTDEQLAIARENVDEFGKILGYAPKLRFVTGYIEKLEEAGVESESVDICISNCVINLSPNKRQVLEGVYGSLRTGGELYFSDMYADRELPESVRSNEVLRGEGMGGALFVRDFEQMAVDIGFARPRVLAVGRIVVHDPELQQMVGDANFYSITYRLFKVQESSADNGPFAAEYLGTIEGHKDKYELDVDHVFETGTPMRVDLGTAAILSSSWLARYFAVKPQANNSLKPAAQITPTETLLDRADQVATSGCGAAEQASTSCCAS
ncbi:hypothetical protein IWW51_002922 [Coemansia sp. RSA 2702]|nr:hypothetical protein IWW51_002922 [Coemansia sp. RSA 2702]